jgi:hypothetical protein
MAVPAGGPVQPLAPSARRVAIGVVPALQAWSIDARQGMY